MILSIAGELLQELMMIHQLVDYQPAVGCLKEQNEYCKRSSNKLTKNGTLSETAD